jgi:hypothetical protein
MSSLAEGETITSDVRIEGMRGGCALAMMLLAQRCSAASGWRTHVPPHKPASPTSPAASNGCSAPGKSIDAGPERRRSRSGINYRLAGLRANYVIRRHKLRFFNTR